MRTSTTTTRKNPTTKQQIKTPTTKSNYRTPGASTTTNSTETGQTVTQQGPNSSSRSSDISSSYRYEQGEQGKPVHTGGAPDDSGWNQGGGVQRGGGDQAPAVAGSFNMDAYQAPPVNASSKSGSAVSRPSTSSSSPAASASYAQPQAFDSAFDSQGQRIKDSAFRAYNTPYVSKSSFTSGNSTDGYQTVNNTHYTPAGSHTPQTTSKTSYSNPSMTAGLSMAPDSTPQKAEEATNNWMDWMNRGSQPVPRSLNPKDQPGYLPEYGNTLGDLLYRDQQPTSTTSSTSRYEYDYQGPDSSYALEPSSGMSYKGGSQYFDESTGQYTGGPNFQQQRQPATPSSSKSTEYFDPNDKEPSKMLTQQRGDMAWQTPNPAYQEWAEQNGYEVQTDGTGRITGYTEPATQAPSANQRSIDPPSNIPEAWDPRESVDYSRMSNDELLERLGGGRPSAGSSAYTDKAAGAPLTNEFREQMISSLQSQDARETPPPPSSEDQIRNLQSQQLQDATTTSPLGDGYGTEVWQGMNINEYQPGFSVTPSLATQNFEDGSSVEQDKRVTYSPGSSTAGSGAPEGMPGFQEETAQDFDSWWAKALSMQGKPNNSATTEDLGSTSSYSRTGDDKSYAIDSSETSGSVVRGGTTSTYEPGTPITESGISPNFGTNTQTVIPQQTDINQVPPQGGTPLSQPAQEQTFAEMDMATRYGSNDEPQSSKYNRYLEYALDQARQIAEGKNSLYPSQGGEPAYTAQNVFVPVTTGIMADNGGGIMNLRPEDAARRMILEDKTALEVTRRKQQAEQSTQTDINQVPPQGGTPLSQPAPEPTFAEMDRATRYGGDDELYAAKEKRYRDYFLRLGEEQVNKRNELNPLAKPLRPDQAQIEVELNGERFKMNPAFAAMHSMRNDKQYMEEARKLEAESTRVANWNSQAGEVKQNWESQTLDDRLGSPEEPMGQKLRRYEEYYNSFRGDPDSNLDNRNLIRAHMPGTNALTSGDYRTFASQALKADQERMEARQEQQSNQTDLNQVPPQGGTQYADLMMATQEEQDRQAGQRSIGGYFPDGSYKSDAMVFNKGTGKWQPDNYDPNNPGHQPGYQHPSDVVTPEMFAEIDQSKDFGQMSEYERYGEQSELYSTRLKRYQDYYESMANEDGIVKYTGTRDAGGNLVYDTTVAEAAIAAMSDDKARAGFAQADKENAQAAAEREERYAEMGMGREASAKHWAEEQEERAAVGAASGGNFREFEQLSLEDRFGDPNEMESAKLNRYATYFMKRNGTGNITPYHREQAEQAIARDRQSIAGNNQTDLNQVAPTSTTGLASSKQSQAASDLLQPSPIQSMQSVSQAQTPDWNTLYSQMSDDDIQYSANQSIMQEFPEYAPGQTTTTESAPVQMINVGGEKAGEYSDKLQDVVGLDSQPSIYETRREQARSMQPVSVSEPSYRVDDIASSYTNQSDALSTSAAVPSSSVAASLPAQEAGEFNATQPIDASAGQFQMAGTENDQTWNFGDQINSQAIAQAYMSPEYAPATPPQAEAPSVYEQALQRYQDNFPDQPENYGRRTTAFGPGGQQLGQSTGYSNDAEAGRLDYQAALINRINKARRPHFQSLGFSSKDADGNRIPLDTEGLMSGSRQDVKDGFSTQFYRDAIASGVDKNDPELRSQLDEMLGISNEDYLLDEDGNPMMNTPPAFDFSKYLPPPVEQTEWETPGIDIRYGRENKPENEGQWVNPVDAYGNPVKRRNMFGYGPGRITNTGDQLVSSNAPR